MGLPQYWLQRRGPGRHGAAGRDGPRARRVSIAIHTHVNAAQSVTPLVAKAARAMLDTGIRDVRNQGVLLRGVNDSPEALLDLCFALLDGAAIMPYYFYMCDMIPVSEHWRVSVWRGPAAAARDHGLPAGLRHPADRLRRAVRRQAVGAPGRRVRPGRGISYWTKNYRTGDRAPTTRRAGPAVPVLRPDQSLPAAGRAWWIRHADDDAALRRLGHRVSLDHQMAQATR